MAIAWESDPTPTLSTKVKDADVYLYPHDRMDKYVRQEANRQYGTSQYDQQISAMHQVALKKPRWAIQPPIYDMGTYTTQASGSALTLDSLTKAVESLEENQLRNAKRVEEDFITVKYQKGLMSFQEYSGLWSSIQRAYYEKSQRQPTYNKCAYCLKEFDDAHYITGCPKKKEDKFNRSLHLLFFRRHKK